MIRTLKVYGFCHNTKMQKLKGKPKDKKAFLYYYKIRHLVLNGLVSRRLFFEIVQFLRYFYLSTFNQTYILC